VISAYEHDPTLPHPILLVFGPFMPPELQSEFQQRIAKLKRLKAITFDARIETLMERALGVIAMGGYNTFCEILSFDKRALIVPRTTPRLEQFIRAERAAARGLVRMLVDDDAHDADQMARALRHLPEQKLPSETVIPGLLGGLEMLNRLSSKWLHGEAPVRRIALQG
jgi:predicted glycosyltransferase